MAVYRFSALTDGQAISFNPDADVLTFDENAIAAADVRAAAQGSDLRIGAGDKDVLLLGVSPFEVTTGNVTFADGSRLLFGNDAANSLTGSTGRDHLAGFGGADTLNGGSGNDTYFVTAGDAIQDSGGNDTIYAETSFALPSAIEKITYLGSGNTSSVGNWQGNVMIGNTGDNYMDGRDGNDTLIGGAGFDNLRGGAGADRFVFAAAPGDANADFLPDFTSNVDTLVLDGAALANVGAQGDFSTADPRFWAASGARSAHDADDRVIYNTSTGDLYYDTDGTGAAVAQRIATIADARPVSSTDFTVINGNAASGVHLTGTNGNDSLAGGPGNDTLDGGAGTDTLNGGLGDDTYINGEVLIDAGGMDTVIAESGILGDGFENLILRPTFQPTGGTGNSLNNVIRNDSAFDAFIDGAGGNDTLIGGSGFDFFTLSDGNDSIDGGGGVNWLAGGSIDFRAGTATHGTGTAVFRNIAVGQGSFSDDRLAADDAGRTLHGEAGNDTVAGGAGSDTLWGDGGFDHPDTNLGNDVVAGAAGNDFLAGGAGNDTLDGGAGNDTLRGAGEDTDGADFFVFSVAPGVANADQITDFLSGRDKVVLDGNAHANTGPSANLAAGDGRFFAGAGANAGQDATDRVIYNTSTGQLWYDADGNGAGASQLIATLQGAPALSAADIAIVNGSGTTTPPSGVITGTSGNDSLTGTSGDDTYYVTSGDVIQDSGGIDQLFAETSFALPSAIEHITYIGTANTSSAGNWQANAMTGNSARNNLDGREGNDTLYGAGGNDTLKGGSGADRFEFGEAGTAHADGITDFVSGTDRVALDDAVFTGVGSAGSFRSGAGLSAGQDADDRLIYNTSTGQLYYDGDGGGGDAGQLIATLSNAPGISAADITVI